MPIEVSIAVKDLSRDEFNRLDAVVMKHAYAAQNKLGRLFDERVYENEMARTLREENHDVYTQVPVTISHKVFQKTYYLDLIVDQMLYELKTVVALAPEHEAQTLHYAMLMNVSRAKLLNFRLERVQGKLCFNGLSEADRQRQRFDTTHWKPHEKACDRLLGQLHDIVSDWGTHLSTCAYTEAMIYFNGGESHCLRRVSVGNLGSHLIQCYWPGMAFVVTSLTRGIEDYHGHLRRLVNHLDLTAVQWFNFHYATIECRTIVKQ